MRKVTVDAPIDSLLEAIGDKLNKVRIQQGMQNSELAEASGVSRATLTNLWAGQPVKLDTLLRVMRALGQRSLIQALIDTPEPTPMEKLAAGNGAPPHERQRVRKKTKRVKRIIGPVFDK